MLQSDHLGQSLHFGAGTGTSRDSKAKLYQLIPVVVRVLPLTGLRSASLTQRGTVPPPDSVGSR